MSNLLQFVQFKGLDDWSIKNYLNANFLKSQFDLVALGELITPRQEKVKKNDYKNDIDLVKKISFKDGVIHLREERKSGMDMYRLHSNDLLVSKINFHQGALAINSFDNELLSSTHYQPYIVNNNISKKYLVLVLRSKVLQNYLSFIKSEGIKTEATYNFIKRLKIPLPSLEIQQQLVKNYQDKLNLAKQQTEQAHQKEAEIKTYLYRELGIELPQEETQNNNILQFVRFKDLQEWGFDFATKTTSNIKSIYPVCKVSDICNIGSGGTPSRDNLEYYKGDIPWVKTGEILNNHILDTLEKITIDGADNKNLKLYPKGSLIMAMYGQGLTRGRISKLNIEATTNQACAVFYNFSNNINIDYLWFYLQNEYQRLRALASGNNQPNLNAQKIKNYPIILPPLKIQNKIANHIQNIKNDIQTLKQQAEQNQKNALIEFEREIFTRQASIENNNAS